MRRATQGVAPARRRAAPAVTVVVVTWPRGPRQVLPATSSVPVLVAPSSRVFASPLRPLPPCPLGASEGLVWSCL